MNDFSSSVFCDRFKSACEFRNESPRDVMKNKIGKDVSNLSKWSESNSIPRADIVFTMAQCLHVTADYLLGLTGNIECEANIDPDEAVLLKAWREADPSMRIAALSVLKTNIPVTKKAAPLSHLQDADLAGA